MCGKDMARVGAVMRPPESPPHVRERLSARIISCKNSRITPACAGKTAVSASIFSDSRDHPRMCGKDAYEIWLASGGRGSPPHVRERPV